MQELLADAICLCALAVKACNPDNWRCGRQIHRMDIGIHQNDAVQGEIVLVEQESVKNARELENQINDIRF